HREKMQAEKRVQAAADRAAAAARQANLGKHVTTDIVTRLTQEWTRNRFSAIEFNDPNDFVKIQFTIKRDGTLISARVISQAKSSSLNAKAAALIKTISSSNYRFPPFDPNYNKSSITISRNFRTK
ncbi:MAG: energy transducer TonB, partial [Lentisphaeraceae bacterium]|nr:energy transducer TonB [Lentisphaeraceae bacterium]